MRAVYFIAEVEYDEKIHDFILAGEPFETTCTTLRNAVKIAEAWGSKKEYFFNDHGQRKAIMSHHYQYEDGTSETVQEMVYKVEY